MAGSGLFLAAAFGFQPAPRLEPLPDLEDVRVAQGRLFCASYTGRRGSDFRIDGVDYVAPFRSCDMHREGVSGPQVEAHWVPLPGPRSQRLLLSLRRSTTGEWIQRASKEDVIRWLDVRARHDPWQVPRLFAAAAGIVVVITALARAHRRRATRVG